MYLFFLSNIIVMEKTGAKIEMSSNKDQSLTFLISGKQETVLRGRRELLVQFQTQASHSIAGNICTCWAKSMCIGG